MDDKYIFCAFVSKFKNLLNVVFSGLYLKQL